MTVIKLLNRNEFALYKKIRLECMKTYPDNFSTTYEEEANYKTLKLSHIFSDEKTNDFIFGAFIENELVGICGFVHETKIKTKHRGEITQMFVKPNFSKQQIGTKLLQAAIDKAFSNNTIEQINLTVIASNEKAVSLYKKVGFIRYGICENFYKDENNYWAETFMFLTRDNYLK